MYLGSGLVWFRNSPFPIVWFVVVVANRDGLTLNVEGAAGCVVLAIMRLSRSAMAESSSSISTLSSKSVDCTVAVVSSLDTSVSSKVMVCTRSQRLFFAVCVVLASLVSSEHKSIISRLSVSFPT